MRRRVSIWSIALAFGPLILLARSQRPVRDNSYLWHLVAGRIQTDGARVITSDPFSFTAFGKPWRTQSWLADLSYSWLFEKFGITSGRWVAAFVGGLVFVVLTVIVRRHLDVGFPMASVMALTALIALPFMNPRPVVFSYLMLALTVLALESKQEWSIPLIGWVWAGFHGSFPLLFVALCFAWVERPRARLVHAGAATLAAVQLTSHGVGIWDILRNFAAGGGALDHIQEWQPPDLVSVVLWPVIAAIAMLVAYVARNGLDWRRGLGILGWFVFGLTANRSVALMWIALLPMIAASAQILSGRVRDRGSLPVPVVLAASLALLSLPFVAVERQGELDESAFPIEAAKALSAERVYAGDGVGGYLIFAQWPERLVYVDDRAELYHEQYVRFTRADAGTPEWRSEFDKWEITQALVRPESPLAEVLKATGWTTRFADEHFEVLDAPA